MISKCSSTLDFKFPVEPVDGKFSISISRFLSFSIVTSKLLSKAFLTFCNQLKPSYNVDCSLPKIYGASDASVSSKFIICSLTVLTSFSPGRLRLDSFSPSVVYCCCNFGKSLAFSY